jgi:hypothetical protein
MSQCTRKPLTVQAVQEAMEQRDGLVHAFIRRQGGDDIPYEEALQRVGSDRGTRSRDMTRHEGQPFPLKEAAERLSALLEEVGKVPCVRCGMLFVADELNWQEQGYEDRPLCGSCIAV